MSLQREIRFRDGHAEVRIRVEPLVMAGWWLVAAYRSPRSLPFILEAFPRNHQALAYAGSLALALSTREEIGQ
jgi:hypothetical protein